MAAVSRRRAIVSFHGLHVWGFLGWLMWLFVHLAFMTGFKNRFTAVVGWAFAFLGRGRAERAIVGDEWISYRVDDAVGAGDVEGLAVRDSGQ